MRLPNASTIGWHERSTFHSNTSSGESTPRIQIWVPLPFALKPTRSSLQPLTLLPELLPTAVELSPLPMRLIRSATVSFIAFVALLMETR